MPFKSEAQRKWMYANHPAMAKRWQEHTPKGKSLPEHVKKKAASALTEALGPAEDVRLGTPFTDGFLKFCLDQGLTNDQVADMLEKGAARDDRVGTECRGLIDRIVALQE